MTWKFYCVILSHGYVINGADKCKYSKFENNVGVIICLYVDDLLILVAMMLCMILRVSLPTRFEYFSVTYVYTI
jgi:hypothetical protein